MKLGTLVVIGAVVAAGSRDASAGPKKLKAQFLCGIYVDGQIVTPIKGKVGKVTDTIACAFHLDDPAEPGHSVTVRTLRKNVELSNVTGVVNDDASDSKDFEVYLKPNEAFKPCEDFDITAGIYDPGGQFTKTIKVQQGCPKPAKLKAELSCTTEYGDGTAVKFPKTKKLQGRLEKTIDCMVYAKKVPDDVKLTGSVWVDGKSPHAGDMEDTAPAGQKLDAQLEPDTDFDSCSGKFIVHASLSDADGAERWTGKLTIPAQFCPD